MNEEETRERIVPGDMVLMVKKSPTKRSRRHRWRSQPPVTPNVPDELGLVMSIVMLNGRAKAHIFWQQSQKYEDVYTENLINFTEFKEPEPKKGRGRPRKKAIV